MTMKSSIAGACAAVLALGLAQTAMAAGPVAKLDAGVVEGLQAGDVLVFKGVPFAATTGGDNRWRAPQPVKPWTGVRPATAFGAACAQPHLGDEPWATVGPTSEDCLFLNVYRPAKTENGGD